MMEGLGYAMQPTYFVLIILNRILDAVTTAISVPRFLGEPIVSIFHLHSAGFFPAASALAVTAFSGTMLPIALHH
jgi:hypothetical protein